MDFRPELSWGLQTPKEIEKRTLRALRDHVRNCLDVSPHYREALSGVNPDGIASFDDFARLPLTDKITLVASVERFLAVDPSRIVETVVTSGSTGKPLACHLTRNDLDRVALGEALSFHGIGATAADRAQILVSLDRLFIAGMAYYRGLTLLGVNVARVGVLPMDMQRRYLELLRPTIVIGVPSFLRKLGNEIRGQGADPRTFGVRKIVGIGESVRTQQMALNGVGVMLSELFDADVYGSYGTTELATPYSECTAQCGNHSHPELIYSEIIDEAGRPVPDGSPGELVATPLGVEAMPLLRYRTGDITFKISEPCSCGRSSSRLGPILARRSQMIKHKGTTLYPLTLTSVLDELDCVEDYVVIIEGDESLSDGVTIHAITPPQMVPSVVNHLQAAARVSFPVLVTNAATIARYRGDSRKKLHVIDKRPPGIRA